MSRADKLVQKLLRFPPRMRFSEVKRVLELYGYEEVRVRGSHHIFRKSGHLPIDVPVVAGREVKVDYLRRIAETLGLEDS